MPKFQKGQSGNPAGRPPGLANATALRAAVAGHLPDIIDVVVAAAKDGDIGAAKLVLDRALPAIKPIELPVAIALPEGTLTNRGEAILNAMGAGQLAPGQAAQLMAALGALSRVTEVDQLAARIARLEAAHAAKP